MSLQGEQDTMVSILQAATTSTAAKLRTPSPDSKDIDLLALAANACRARRYQGEESTSSVAVGPWQGVVDEVGIAIRRLEAEVEGLERERRILEECWQTMISVNAKKMTCQKVSPAYIYEGHIAVAGQFVPETAGFRDLGGLPIATTLGEAAETRGEIDLRTVDLHKSLGYTNL
ncbi:hypothetical protein B0T13DRAFT_448670 [Neurospora crassa]|nr:hypothetical protein B0T13DRAFT_448670 [Neurospora crassa]